MGDIVTDIDFTAAEYQPLIVDATARYVVTDPSGLVVNVIVWDGTTPYDPGDGLTLHPLPDDSPVGPGDTVTIDKGDVTVTAKAEPVAAEPTLEERLARVEAKTDTTPDTAKTPRGARA